MEKTLELYDQITNPILSVRRIYVVANHVSNEKAAVSAPEQIDLFSLLEEEDQKKSSENLMKEKEKKLQNTVLSIKKKHGKNAILHGTSYLDGATGKERNQQVGGHRK